MTSVLMAASAFVVVVMMTAASAFMMMAFTSSFAMMAATFALTVVSAAAAFTAHAVDEALYLFVGCLARFYDMPLEVKRLACQRVVKVNLHLVVTYREHTPKESVAVLVLQRHDGVFVNIVMVKVAVDAEDVLVQVKHMLLLIVSVGIVFLKSEVKFGTGLKSGDFFLECIKSYSVSAYELERLFVSCFFNEFALSVVKIGRASCRERV